MALLRQVLNKSYPFPLTMDQCSILFEKFTHFSAKRAGRRKAPLNFSDIQNIWNTFVLPNQDPTRVYKDLRRPSGPSPKKSSSDYCQS